MKSHDERRNEILDVAMSLFFSRGYSDVSVATLIEKIGIAKGTFYHYFNSKEELLSELVLREAGRTLPGAEAIIADPALTAPRKLQRLFEFLGAWKADNRDLMIATTRALYRDESILIRHKMEQASIGLFAPMISTIVRQGVAEGTFSTPFVDQSGEVILSMWSARSNKIGALFLEAIDRPDRYGEVLLWMRAMENTIQRFLGLPDESLRLFDEGALRRMLTTPDESPKPVVTQEQP